MNRSHLWKFLLIIFIVAWSLYEFNPPTGRDIIEVFKEQAQHKDAAFTNLLQNLQALQKETTNRSSYAYLKDAVKRTMGQTNDISKYFPEIPVKGEKDPNNAVLTRLQRDNAGKVKLG